MPKKLQSVGQDCVWQGTEVYKLKCNRRRSTTYESPHSQTGVFVGISFKRCPGERIENVQNERYPAACVLVFFQWKLFVIFFQLFVETSDVVCRRSSSDIPCYLFIYACNKPVSLWMIRGLWLSLIAQTDWQFSTKIGEETSHLNDTVETSVTCVYVCCQIGRISNSPSCLKSDKAKLPLACFLFHGEELHLSHSAQTSEGTSLGAKSVFRFKTPSVTLREATSTQGFHRHWLWSDSYSQACLLLFPGLLFCLNGSKVGNQVCFRLIHWSSLFSDKTSRTPRNCGKSLSSSLLLGPSHAADKRSAEGNTTVSQGRV